MSFILVAQEGRGLSLESKIQRLREVTGGRGGWNITGFKCPEKKIRFYAFGERINSTIPIVNYKIISSLNYKLKEIREIYLPAQKAEGDKVRHAREILYKRDYHEEEKAILMSGYPFFAFDKPINGSTGITWFPNEITTGMKIKFDDGSDEHTPFSHFHTVIKNKSGLFSIIDDLDLKGTSCEHRDRGKDYDKEEPAYGDIYIKPHFYAFTKESLNRYFIENLDNFKHINNYSMIKDELTKIDELVAEKASFKHYDIEVKEADVRKVITNSTMSNRNKDILFQATLQNPNMTPYEYKYLKQELSQNTYATKEISPRQEIKKNKNIESSYLMIRYDKRKKAFGYDQKLSTIKPTWEEIINHFGSYSKLAENNINKEDYEIGNYDISLELLNIELLSPETFLAEIQFKTKNDNALAIKKIPKSIIKIEGNYNYNPLKLKDLLLIGKTYEPFIDFYFKKNKELSFMKNDNQLFSTRLSYPWKAFNENYPIENLLNYKKTANLLLDDNLKYEDLIVWIVNNDL